MPSASCGSAPAGPPGGHSDRMSWEVVSLCENHCFLPWYWPAVKIPASRPNSRDHTLSSDFCAHPFCANCDLNLQQQPRNQPQPDIEMRQGGKWIITCRACRADLLLHPVSMPLAVTRQVLLHLLATAAAGFRTESDLMPREMDHPS